jgi:RNA polymerase sigma-B factor
MDLALFARRDRGDPHAREELIERFLPLARSNARRYEHSGEPLDDLVQVASLALVKAVDGYDPARGFAFSSYAVPTIAGELKRYFRDRTWSIRPPRDLQERVLRVDAAVNELAVRLDRSPTVAEITAETGCSDEQILEAIQARRTRSTTSLHAPLAGGPDEPATLGDVLGAADDGYAQAEARAELDGLLHLLPARARLALRLRFEQDLTQVQIGELLGVSQMQVSRIIRAAIDQLAAIADGRGRRVHDRQSASV